MINELNYEDVWKCINFVSERGTRTRHLKRTYGLERGSNSKADKSIRIKVLERAQSLLERALSAATNSS